MNDLISEARRWPQATAMTGAAEPADLIGRLADALEEARAGKAPAPPAARTFVAIDPGDPDGEPMFYRDLNGVIVTEDEHGVSLVASGGWVSPSSVVADFVASGRLEIPEIKVARSGQMVPSFALDLDAKIEPEPTQTPQKRLHYGPGRWEYGVDVADYDDGDTEPEIIAGYGGSWDAPEPFTSAEEAAEYHPGGKVYKRWVAGPGLWKDAEK